MIQQPQFYQPYGQYGYCNNQCSGYTTPPQASAVNIQIFEPKAYGGNATCPPQFEVPQVSYPQPLYPQGSIFAPETPYPYQPQYIQQPQMPYGIPSQQMPIPQFAQPVPAVQTPPVEQAYNTPPYDTTYRTPEPAIAPVPVPLTEYSAQPEEVKPVMPTDDTPPVDAVKPVEINAPEEQPVPTVDVESLSKDLNSPDLNAQTDAITKIAQLSQAEPAIASQVVDERLMQNLLGIIKRDTSDMQGPSQQQINVSRKLKNGEQLTPNEQALLNQSSPRETAEKNKVFAMFTLSMLQKLLRDEVDNYNETATEKIPPLDITPFVSEIQNAISNSEIPAVKAAGIQALSYIASKPEDKPILENAIGSLVNDSDPNVSAVAKEALAKVNSTLAA